MALAWWEGTSGPLDSSARLETPGQRQGDHVVPGGYLSPLPARNIHSSCQVGHSHSELIHN